MSVKIIYLRPLSLFSHRLNYVIAVILMTLFITDTIHSQNLILKGFVSDENNGSLEGVSIILNEGKYHTSTDASGNFIFTALPEGNYHMDVYLFGYTTMHIDLNLRESIRNMTIKMSPGVLTLNEVEIHANATLKKQKETSLNIEVANDEFIRNNLKTSLMKSLEDLPGVSSIDIGAGQSKPVIRGLSFNQVAVAENGIKHEGQQWGEEHGLEIDPYSVRNVQIIKGPASLLYGSDAIGGIILIDNSSVPYNDGFQSDLSLNTKSFNSSFGGSLHFSKRKNSFFSDARISYNDYGDYRIPVDHVNIYSYKAGLKDNYLRNTAGKDLGIHGQIGYVSDKHKTIVFLSYYNSDNAFFANAHGLEPRYVDLNLHDKDTRDIQEPHQLANHFKALMNSSLYTKKGHWDLEVAYQKNIRSEYSPYVNHGYMPAVFPDNSIFKSNLERYFNKDIISLNIKREIINEGYRLNFGINTEYQNNRINGWSFIIPEFKRGTAGGYFFGKYNLNSNTIVNAGIRYDQGLIGTDEYRDWFESKNIDGTTEKIIRSAALNKTYGALSWATGISYGTGHISLKANIGKSFRMPVANEIASNGVNYHHFSYEKGDKGLNPEISYQLDLSTEWNYKKWALKISPFVNYFTNYIYLNPTSDYDFLYGAGNQVYVYTQAEVLRFGSELHYHYNFIRFLTFDLIGEYVYSRQMSGSKKGFGLPFTSPANIIAKLTFSMNDIWKFKNSEMTLMQKYNFSQNNIVPPEEKTPASSIWDFQIQTEIDILNRSWQIQLQFNNIFNTRYFSHTNYYRIIGVPEQGRNFTCSLMIPLTK